MADPVQAQPQQMDLAQKVIQAEEYKVETLREHLTSLQTWQGTEGETLEQQRDIHRQRLSQQQVEENATLQAGMQQQVAPINATQTAQGAPVQTQAAAKQTWKEKREQKRRAKEANKKVKGADHVSYALHETLENQHTNRNNSLKAYGSSKLKDSGVDDRVLAILCKGYKTDRKGNPASPEDASNKASDAKTLEDYCSKNLERRKPYLTKFVSEVQEYTFAADMFAPEKLLANIGKYKEMGDKMAYFQNVQQDPINKPFFDAMHPADLQLLKGRLDAMASIFSSHLINKAAMKGVVLDGGGYVQSQLNVTTAQGMDDAYSGIFEQSLQRCKEAEDAHFEQLVAERKAEEMATADSLYEQITSGEEFADLHDIAFSTFATGLNYDDISKYRTMIEHNPVAYAEHQPLVDQMYQEYYRGMDAMGDLNLELKGIQGVTDTYRQKAETSPYYRKLVSKALGRQTEIQDQAKAHMMQMMNISDSMEFYLRGKPLSDQALLYLNRVGAGAAAKEIHHLREAKKLFSGEGGAIQKSNEALRKAKNAGDNPSSARSSALQAFGIRTSSSKTAQADKALRGDTYVQLPEQISNYFQAKKDAGANMDTILNKSVRQANYSFGEGIDEITGDLLSMTKELILSEKSVDYLTKMHSVMGEAEVFENSANESIQFLVHGLMNSYGANYTAVNKKGDQGKTYDLARESCRTLLAMPTLMRKTKEEKDALPPHIQGMLASYTDMINNLTKKVTDATGGTPTP